MAKMKKETIEYIGELLETTMEANKNTMIAAIDCGYSDESILTRIREYKKASKALDDFSNWEEEIDDG